MAAEPEDVVDQGLQDHWHAPINHIVGEQSVDRAQAFLGIGFSEGTIVYGLQEGLRREEARSEVPRLSRGVRALSPRNAFVAQVKQIIVEP